MTERILVLGGSGFIGSNLIEALCREGKEVTGLSRTPPQKYLTKYTSDWVVTDYSISDTIKKPLTDCSIVYHLISSTHPTESNKNRVIVKSGV